MNTLESLSQYRHPCLFPPSNQPILKPPRAFLPKLNVNHASPLTHALVFNTLRSYQDILLPGHGLPPFIHPQCFRIAFGRLNTVQYKTRQCPPQPPAICASIVQMFKGKTNENSDFIWSTLRNAQQRLVEEVSSLSDWDLVAALQAMAVYFILRISEGDENYMSFDMPLIQTIIVSCLLLSTFKLLLVGVLADL